MSLPNRTESFVNGSFAFTSVVVSSESDFSDLNGLLSAPDIVDPDIIEPKSSATLRLSEEEKRHEKIYRLDQAEESLTPNLDVLRQNVFASVKSKLVDVSIDVAKINRERQLFQTFKDIESHLPIVVSQYADLPNLPTYEAESQSTAEPEPQSELKPQSESETQIDFNDLYQTIEIHPPKKQVPKPNFRIRKKDRVATPTETAARSNESARDSNRSIDDHKTDETLSTSEGSEKAANAFKLDFNQVIQPAWEVKQFRWSEITSKLIRDYRNAFSKLVQSLKLNGEQSSARIAIVNTQAGQGATTLASCLSTILSETSARTMLIDLDFENPSVESAANIRIENGWQKVLDGISINEVLVRSTANQLTLMPLKKTDDLHESRNEIASQLEPLTEVLEKHLEFLVYDAGNYSQLMSLPCGASFWDAIVVVSDSKVKESTSDAVLAYEKLLQAGAKSVVIAENFRH